MLNLDKHTDKKAPSVINISSAATYVMPTSAQAMEAVGKTFESTSTLMARDRRFGRLNIGLQDVMPPPIDSIIDEKLAVILDK